MPMTIGEKLLELSAEYQQAKAVRDTYGQQYGGDLEGREPSVIAADYEQALRELLIQV